MGAKKRADCLQVGNLQVKVRYFFLQKGFQAGGGAVFHESLYFADGNVQLP